MKKKLIPIALVLLTFTTGGTTSPGDCQTKYNNNISYCDQQYQLDMQVAQPLLSPTGGLSFGTSLARNATKKYNDCKESAIRMRDNCSSNGVK